MSFLSFEDLAKVVVLINRSDIRPLEPDAVRRVLRKEGHPDEIVEAYILQRSFAQQ